MAETPSKRRRKGRNDFDPNTDPMDIQPYNKKSWWYESHLQDWLDGWNEAKEVYEEETKIEIHPWPEEINLNDLLNRIIEIERKLNDGGIY